jgi:hypothetical protein
MLTAVVDDVVIGCEDAVRQNWQTFSTGLSSGERGVLSCSFCQTERRRYVSCIIALRHQETEELSSGIQELARL